MMSFQETKPTDHELNQCLAEVAEVEVWEDGFSRCMYYRRDPQPLGGYIYAIEWTPLTDANQMQLVEEKLLPLVTTIFTTTNKYRCDVCIEYINTHQASAYARGGDLNKLRAFALAVYAMKQQEKKGGMKVEISTEE